VNIRFLETFLWAARLGSFSKAADKLNTTQAAVSHRIATLEQDLGARLFERDTRRIRLSSEGERALVQAEEIVTLAGRLRESLNDRSTLRGTVQIGSVDTLVYAWLPTLIGRVRESYPSINLDVNVDTSLKVAQQLAEGSIDVAILMGPVAHPDIRSLEISTFESCWTASTALELPEHDIELADIAAYPLLTFSRGSQPHHALLALLKAAGLDEMRIYNSNSLAIMTRLVSSGVGIGALPIVLVQDLVAAGTVRLLDIQPRVPSLTFHIAYRERSADALARLIVEVALDVAPRFDEAKRPIAEQA
jgi:DNA-binding transcriptional LysR family regulator